MFGENNLKYKMIKLIIMLFFEIGVINKEEFFDIEKVIIEILNVDVYCIFEIFKRVIFVFFGKVKVNYE